MSTTVSEFPTPLTARALRWALQDGEFAKSYKVPLPDKTDRQAFRAVASLLTTVSMDRTKTIDDLVSKVFETEDRLGTFFTAKQLNFWQANQERGSQTWKQLGILRDFYKKVDRTHERGSSLITPVSQSLSDGTLYTIEDPSFSWDEMQKFALAKGEANSQEPVSQTSDL